MHQYCKKPVVIEAFRWTGEPEDQIETPAWIVEGIKKGDVWVDKAVDPSDPDDPSAAIFLMITTLEGVMCALVGDWIIRGVKGELYPCKPDIFEATYEIAAKGPAVPQEDDNV